MKFICKNCEREVETFLKKKVKCKICKKRMEVKEKPIYKSKPESGWTPSLSGDEDTDDNSRFLINGKSVQGIPSKDEHVKLYKKCF